MQHLFQDCMADCVRSFLYGSCTKQNVYHSKTLGIKITLLVLLHPSREPKFQFSVLQEEILIEFKTEISFKNNWNYFNGMPNEFSLLIYSQQKIELKGCFAISHTCFWTPSQTVQLFIKSWSIKKYKCHCIFSNGEKILHQIICLAQFAYICQL